MKAFLFILLLITWSTFASAGNPSEDPVVAQIRTNFAKGTTPTIHSLNLRAKWKCMDMFATDGTFLQYGVIVQFNSFGELIQPVLYESDGTRKVNDPSCGAMAITPHGLVGKTQWALRYSETAVFRMTADGSLVAEMSVLLTGRGTDPLSANTSSIYDSKLNVVRYWTCPKDQILTHQQEPGICESTVTAH